jgi:hypothetical protein
MSGSLGGRQALRRRDGNLPGLPGSELRLSIPCRLRARRPSLPVRDDIASAEEIRAHRSMRALIEQADRVAAGQLLEQLFGGPLAGPRPRRRADAGTGAHAEPRCAGDDRRTHGLAPGTALADGSRFAPDRIVQGAAGDAHRPAGAPLRLPIRKPRSLRCPRGTAGARSGLCGHDDKGAPDRATDRPTALPRIMLTGECDPVSSLPYFADRVVRLTRWPQKTAGPRIGLWPALRF